MDADTKQKYRDTLQKMESESQVFYDKAVLTLSGGAFYLSFAYVSNFIKGSEALGRWWLTFSWIFWALSILVLLLSHLFSAKSCRYAVEQLDKNKLDEKTPGGIYEKATHFCNFLGCVMFISGVITMCIFVVINTR